VTTNYHLRIGSSVKLR